MEEWREGRRCARRGHGCGCPSRTAPIGGVALWLGARLDYRLLKRWTYPLLAFALLLLGLALATHAKNGAKRWIPLGPFTFQPVEVAKLALVTYLASSLGRKADHVKT